MINFLEGTIYAKQKQTLTLLTSSGVGYEVGMTKLRLAEQTIGSELSVFVYTKVSESAIQLYGFLSAEEKDFFELVLSVKGVGPKSALNILSLGSIQDIQSAIARGDAKYLSVVQGMGKKTAERLCVELKNKVQVSELSSSVAPLSSAAATVAQDVIEALTAMGYSKDEAKKRVSELSIKNQSIEEVLKLALRT